jgi:hypothetical protein
MKRSRTKACLRNFYGQQGRAQSSCPLISDAFRAFSSMPGILFEGLSTALPLNPDRAGLSTHKQKAAA